MQPPILTLDENTLKDEISDLVRGTVEEALMGTCPLGVSTRNVEDAARALWDEGLPAGTAPNPDQEAYEKVDAWRRPLASERPYVHVDGTYARRNWGGAHEGVAVLVAIGADSDGRREAVGVEEGHGESEDPWREFLLGPGDRGLAGAGPAAGDKSAGMLGALSEALPSAEHQRRTVHSCRNVLAKVPKRRRKAVATRPEVTRAQESLEASVQKTKEVAGDLGARRRREGRRRGARGDARLRALPSRALEENPHQQRNRAPEQGNQAQDQGRRQLPRRPSRHDARGGSVQVHGRGELGDQEVPRRQPPRGMGREGVGRGPGTQVQEFKSSPAPVGLFAKNY